MVVRAGIARTKGFFLHTMYQYRSESKWCKDKMTFEDGPLNEVLAKPAKDVETRLRVRAWEVAESSRDLGYKVVKEWPKLPHGWMLGGVGGGIAVGVAGVAVDTANRYYVYHRGNRAPPLAS